MTNYRSIKYRHHQVRAGHHKGKMVAVVFEDRTKLDELDGSTIEEAIDRARAWIDDRLQMMCAGRRASHIGTKDEYVRALSQCEIGNHQRAMLRAHARAPRRSLTMKELAAAAGYSGYPVANAHYGALGRKVAEFLQLRVPVDPHRNEWVWTKALADEDEETGPDGHFRWVMHEELVAALVDVDVA